jgi:hypothetical protein
MIVDVDKIVVSLDVVAPDAVVVEASAVLPNDVEVDFDIELPVITISHEEIPTISPLEIIDYSSTSIECAFDVTTEQAEEVVKGVLCGTTNPPTFENADYRLLHGQGSMDLAFAGLHNNTEYYLRPYALSNLGYKYGDVIAQRTKAIPIPDEYQLVEYLQSFASQRSYINTGCKPTISSTIEIKYDEYSNAGNASVASSRGESRVTFAIIGAGPGVWYGSNNTPISFGLHTVLLSSEKVIIDGTTYQIHTNYVNNGYDFYLFAQNRMGSPSDFSSTKIIYFFFKDGNIEKKLYPVYRKSDNKPGIYDIVNGTFYTNQGTGEFTVGPDKEWEE